MSGIAITYAQRLVLNAVREIGADGWPVGVREVCEQLGYASKSTGFTHLTALERYGLLVRNPRGDGWRIAE